MQKSHQYGDPQSSSWGTKKKKEKKKKDSGFTVTWDSAEGYFRLGKLCFVTSVDDVTHHGHLTATSKLQHITDSAPLQFFCLFVYIFAKQSQKYRNQSVLCTRIKEIKNSGK